MEGQVPENVKTVRSNMMLELDEQKRGIYESQFIGTEVEVLVEEKIQKNDQSFWVGHTKEYVKVAVFNDANLQNQLTKVQIHEKSQIMR